MPSSKAAPSSAVPSDVRCGSPEWRLFYERVGRYFEKPETGTTSGICSVCGIPVENVVNGSLGPTCAPLRTASQKRGKVGDSGPFAYDPAVADRPGKAALTNVGVVVLIEADRCYVATNVAPTRPLPADMTVSRVSPGSTGRFLAELAKRPPKPPFLLIEFDNKVPPLAMSHSLGRTAWCGKSSVEIVDLSRILEQIAIAGRLGPKLFASTASLKDRLATAGGLDPATLKELRTAGLGADELDIVPGRSSLLYSIVDKAVREAAPITPN